MKIAVISTTIMKCPPTGYSGLEMIAWQQAKGLAEKGHSVLLVAPVGSTVPNGVELHGTTLGESEKQAYSGYWQRLRDYDCIIDSSWEKWSYILKMEGRLPAPILGVIHAPAHTMYQVAPPVPKPCIVAISKDQASAASEIWGIDTRVAYNGIDLDFYKSNGATRSDKYLFLARMSRIKGAHLAVEIARSCGVPLDLVGDDKITGEPEYAQALREQAVGNIKYVGGVSRAETVSFYSSGLAMLHMVQTFREPFGLAPVEAQACGMPVIAFDNGAMRETVKHGETGFIVQSVDEAVGLIKTDAVRSIKSEACRKWASQFSIQAMVDRYEILCKEALETGGW